jgi:hypothetical protein
MTVVCVGCGEAMGLRPRGKSVCSVRCWWRAYRARRRREMRQRCASCEDVFTPTRRDAQYCSAACRQHSFRERQAGRWRPREWAPPFRVREEAPVVRAPVLLDRAGGAVAIDIASLIG